MRHKKILLALALMLALVTLASCSFVSSLLPQPKSAYDVAVENGFQGSEEDWLASLKGNDGNEGNQGKSAYDLYRDLFGYEGTEEQWLIDLRTGALISFKVAFDLNGGQAPEGFVSSVTVCGGSFLDLKTPTRDGYTFVGWWTGDGDTDFAMTATTAVRSDLSLKAKWRKDVMSVRFLDKDGKLLKQENVPYGGAATAPEAPEVAHFLFQKWNVDFSVISEDLTVKAVYSPLYTLSFDTDGGTAIDDVTYIAGEVPAAPADPQNEGLVFRGWYADKDFTVPYDFSAPITQNTTVYAYFSDLKPISNAEELMAIGENSTGKFYLTNDINLGGATWTPIVGFAGEFDGRGYKIHNFIISETESAGFFTTNSGTIQNLTLADFVFTVSSVDTNAAYIAGVLAHTNDGIIKNCHITDAVVNYTFYLAGYSMSSFAGALVGKNNGTISEVTISTKMSANLIHDVIYSGTIWFYVGGVVGENSGEVENVTANIVLASTASADNNGYPVLNIGGIVSKNIGTIKNSSANIDISCDPKRINANGHWRQHIECGGLVGENSGAITQCSATGSIKVTGNVQSINAGGFVAINLGSAEIKDCFSRVDITTGQNDINSRDQSAVGGFVGANKGGIIVSSYSTSTIDTCTGGSVGGFVGQNKAGGSINKCFAMSNIIYREAHYSEQPVGVGCFVGLADSDSALAKNYYSAESKIMQGETDVTAEDPNATAADPATLQSYAFLVDTLGWKPEVWEIIDGQYPTLVAVK